MTIDSTELKKTGLAQQKQEDVFLARFRSLAGNLTSQQLRQIADLAEKYGKGYVHITTRQGAEIPWIENDSINDITKDIQQLGLNIGAFGTRVRTVVACPGNEVCRFGLMNSRKTALEIDQAFFGRETPSKVKIAVSGCPNSCAKPQENDIGFVGAVEPVFRAENCTGCAICEDACNNQAISLKEDLPVMDPSRCLRCGKCIYECPSDAWQEGRKGYKLYAGGKIGRKPGLGQIIADMVPEERVVEAIQKVLAAFASLRREGERIADTVARVGIEAFKAECELALQPDINK